MTLNEFQQIAHKIPGNPGIYKYYDEKNELIYVGKAINLRKRVSSYFTKNYPNYKTHELVKRIAKIDFTIVDSEQDAFLLENSLIKQFQPKYNINLKDDKTYPYVVIKKEPFPRVYLTRNKIPDGSVYIGPFTSIHKIREILGFIRLTIPLRTCKLNLTDNNIRKGKYKVCLEYHLGNCLGPCEGLQTAEDYDKGIQQVKNILKGNLTPVLQSYKQEMLSLANELQFEKAEILKKKIQNLEDYQSRSVIVSPHLADVDVFSLLRDGDIAYVNYLMVKNGTIIQTHTAQLKPNLEESDEEILTFGIAMIRDNLGSDAPEIIVPFDIDYPSEGITITVPKAGDKKKLLGLSEKNVNYFIEEIRKKKTLHLEGKDNMERKKVLYKLQADLRLPELPVHIECFDNSNFQGAYPVSAMACFKDGIPSKKDYRRYHVKTVEGINDFATMKEVVTRRYRRLIEEEASLPQLIIIDGGKGQLNAAVEALKEMDLFGKTTVIGLAKNEEELFFPGDKESVKLAYNGESLKLIRRIRDEVHRFGVTFHRQLRSKGTIKNELQNIKGIGRQTADLLMKTFKSVKKIKETDEAELVQLIGVAKTKLIKEYFSNAAKQ